MEKLKVRSPLSWRDPFCREPEFYLPCFGIHEFCGGPSTNRSGWLVPIHPIHKTPGFARCRRSRGVCGTCALGVHGKARKATKAAAPLGGELNPRREPGHRGMFSSDPNRFNP